MPARLVVPFAMNATARKPPSFTSWSRRITRYLRRNWPPGVRRYPSMSSESSPTTSAAAAKTGAVTLIQRFGGALNLNVHFHMLLLDGVYVDGPAGPRFRWVKAPSSAELRQLSHTIARRVSRFLERQGLLARDDESAQLTLDTNDDDPMDTLIGHSITYRIATGPRQGRKVMTLQSLPAIDEPPDTGAGNVSGFSLHAGVAAKANERHKLERLCRYITRPAVSEKRLSFTAHGQVRYSLKTPWNDGTTHVIFERGGHPPLDFMARLAALLPKPRVNLTRFHGPEPRAPPPCDLFDTL